MYKHLPIFFILFLCMVTSNHHEVWAEEILTWSDCIKEAQKNHPDLISAQEGIKEREASKKITESSVAPQIHSSVDASTSKSSTAGKTTHAYSYGVTGTQLLFDKSKTRDNINAASENIKAAQYDYKFTSSEVRFLLRNAFIRLFKAQESLFLTEEIRKIRKNNLELISLRYESGIEHKGALLTAEANLSQAEFEITQTKRALQVAQRELLKEMGRTQFSPIRAEEAVRTANLTSERPDFEILASNNPSLGKRIAQKNAASFTLKAAEANFFPELSAEAGAGKSGSRWAPDNNQWNAGLSISFPLFEGGLKQAELSQAKALFNQAQADERSVKNGLIVALEETWAALQDAVETAEVQKKFLNAAQERAKIAEEQYSLGLLKFDNWTIIEDDLIRTKKTFLDTQVNMLQAEADWIQAKGETLEYAD
ncbi:MAG: TolC family protein [Candidatus Omnitrophota bacterium]